MHRFRHAPRGETARDDRFGTQFFAPYVPTFKEQSIGVMEGVDAWYGVMAPGRTPPALVAQLNRDLTTC
ncbi:tripartite tricarboxylate transporter substrate-binding protein [Variovorax sp. 770b2]|uniref:tripartite tricarboxylate transporter substrate-binding protein n=1 Tax=Variovorax sp. 770b2 TaxID=1566271 RepID=UPI0011608E90|nr:tripartite tricarboxylate transporter substrate-binding protein [Variovorax sp. 770b2]